MERQSSCLSPCILLVLQLFINSGSELGLDPGQVFEGLVVEDKEQASTSQGLLLCQLI